MRRPPRIAFLPAGDERFASSRLRVFTLVRALVAAGISAHVGYTEDVDVLIVQKRLDEGVLEAARTARTSGSLVVYDVDDLGDALAWWAPEGLLPEVLSIADLVLTGTPEQQRALRKLGASNVRVLPCAVDYYPTGLSRPEIVEAAPLRVAWFGNDPHFELFAPYLEVLASLRDVQPVVVIDSDSVGGVRARFPGASVEPWSLETFVPVLQSCQLSCLTHDGSEEDRAKSNNRMTTSIAWGVPALVSRTPDYERTAHYAGVAGALVGAPDELRAAVARLQPAAARRAYLDAAQNRIWRRYSPDAIAHELLALLRRERRVRRVVRRALSARRRRAPS